MNKYIQHNVNWVCTSQNTCNKKLWTLVYICPRFNSPLPSKIFLICDLLIFYLLFSLLGLTLACMLSFFFLRTLSNSKRTKFLGLAWVSFFFLLTLLNSKRAGFMGLRAIHRLECTPPSPWFWAKCNHVREQKCVSNLWSVFIIAFLILYQQNKIHFTYMFE